MALTTVTIKSNGKVMSQDFEILSIDVSKEFNKVPRAELKLIDGDVSKSEFHILDGDFFELGKQIEIALKYEGEPNSEERVFSGIVTQQGLSLDRMGTTLMVDLADEAVKMTRGRSNAIFANKKDSEIITSLVAKHGLTAGSIAATKLAHAQMVQYYSSDWDFVMARAEANGHLLLSDDGEVSTVEPEVGTPFLDLELGRDVIYDFDLQVSSLDQYDQVESRAWDIAKQSLTQPSKGKDYPVSQGNFKVDALAKSVGGEKVDLIHPVALHPDELESWAGAQVIKSRLSLIRGWIKIPGTAKVKVGQTLEIKGVSQRFAGKNIICGVRHHVSTSDWVTHLQIGMDANWFMSRHSAVDSQAAGLLPGVNGLQIGVVLAHEKDPDNEFRVKINIPALDSKKESVWARLTSPDAGDKRGVFFRPEVGDEVIVGFLNDDPRQAIILGAMHSSAHQTPLPVSAENGQKGMVTKLGYHLIFDEENETISLATSEKNRIEIDEKNGRISINDAHGNQLEMSDKGLVIDCIADCTISTKGNFEIAAEGNVKIDGKKVDLI